LLNFSYTFLRVSLILKQLINLQLDFTNLFFPISLRYNTRNIENNKNVVFYISTIHKESSFYIFICINFHMSMFIQEINKTANDEGQIILNILLFFKLVNTSKLFLFHRNIGII
jgi:hypothetical protein